MSMRKSLYFAQYPFHNAFRYYIINHESSMGTSVQDNLKNLMLSDEKISEGELSRKTGIPQSTIHRILTGQIKESKPSTLKPLAGYFGLTLAQLQGEEPIPVQRQTEVFQKAQHKNNDRQHYLGTPARLIPLISWEDAANWKKICKSYQHNSNNGWVATNKNVGPYAFGLHVQGNSMTSTHGPSFEDGCELVIDPERKPQHHDYVVVKQSDKSSTILRQLSIEGGEYVLFPLNPRYPVTPLKDPKDICGVVCQLLANF
jgi:SOS-response transcriptional repressor LexA